MRSIFALPSSFIARRLSSFFSLIVMAVLDNLDVREHHQPLLDHVIENRKEGVQFFLRVYDGEQDRPVMREAQRLFLMNSSIRAVSQDALVNGGAGNVIGAHALQKGLVQRF